MAAISWFFIQSVNWLRRKSLICFTLSIWESGFHGMTIKVLKQLYSNIEEIKAYDSMISSQGWAVFRRWNSANSPLEFIQSWSAFLSM